MVRKTWQSALCLGYLSLGDMCGASTTTPSPLYSSMVAQKVLRTALAPPNPMQYPQYTDRVAGDWVYFVPDLWTSGFFPATLYAMHTRAQICHWDPANASQWLSLGQQWSTAEVPLETENTVGHDVGFLSYPFVEELAVLVMRSMLRRDG